MASNIEAIAAFAREVSLLQGRLGRLEKDVQNFEAELRGFYLDIKLRLIEADARLNKEEKYELTLSLEKRRSQLRFARCLKRLPYELILHIMRHTPLPHLDDLLSRSKAAAEFFETCKYALFRGMEIEQFSDLEWLFGNSIHRSFKQKHALKDCLYLTLDWKSDEELFDIFKRVDEGKFAGRDNIESLQSIDNLIDVMTGRFNLTRRAAMCLIMFRLDRVVLHEDNGVTLDEDETKSQSTDPDTANCISIRGLPMVERIELYQNQSVEIQAELREAIELAVFTIIRFLDSSAAPFATRHGSPLLGKVTVRWIRHYYGPKKTDDKMELKFMGRWLANLAVGYVLHSFLPNVGERLLHIAGELEDQLVVFSDALMMELETSGSTDTIWRGERDFAYFIGFDWSWILNGTRVGAYLARKLIEENLMDIW